MIELLHRLEVESTNEAMVNSVLSIVELMQMLAQSVFTGKSHPTLATSVRHLLG